MRICKTCRAEKPLDEFYKAKSCRDGRQPNCRACLLDKMKQRHAKSPEKMRNRTREWKLKNPGATYANIKKNRAINPEKHNHETREYKRRNKEKCQQTSRIWRLSNRSKCVAKEAAYRAAKKQAMPSWVNRQKIQEIYARAARLTRETGVRHEVDHIYPLKSEVMCGLHCEANLQIITLYENRSKHSRIVPIVGDISLAA